MAIARGQIPVRLETKHGEGKWRGVLRLEHADLCRAFNLDPVRFYFDLPSSARGVGSNMTGAGGGRANRVINGYVMRGGDDRPYGKITVCTDAEKFRDVDPSDIRELERLS